jgi:hypothetical protein
LNTKLLHKFLKCDGACHEVTFLTAVKDSLFATAGSIVRPFCLNTGAMVSGAPAELGPAVEISKNAGNGCAILNSGFGFGIK